MSSTPTPAPAPAASKPIRTWKRIALISVFGGAGFAVVISAIVGLAIWYMSRTKPPKPWNANAIKATFDYVDTTGDNNDIVFYYILENTTNQDYSVPSKDSMHLTGRLLREKELSEFDSYEKIHYPIFIPAKKRLRFAIEIPYPYPERISPSASTDEQREYRKGIGKYLKKEAGNLDGFELFDSGHRYEIDFPAGW